MADPVLDEGWIIALLNTPVDQSTVDRIQAGAVQALVDLYDRKVEREQFLELATPCLALYGQCAKLWILKNVEHAFDTSGLDTNSFRQAEKGLSDLITKQAEHVTEIVKRLMECPTSEDKVH